jgi:hypothetical protein
MLTIADFWSVAELIDVKNLDACKEQLSTITTLGELACVPDSTFMHTSLFGPVKGGILFAKVRAAHGASSTSQPHAGSVRSFTQVKFNTKAPMWKKGEGITEFLHGLRTFLRGACGPNATDQAMLDQVNIHYSNMMPEVMAKHFGVRSQPVTTWAELEDFMRNESNQSRMRERCLSLL